MIRSAEELRMRTQIVRAVGGSCRLSIAVKQQIVKECGEIGFVVDLFEELEVRVEHVLNMIAHLVVERQAGVFAGC